MDEFIEVDGERYFLKNLLSKAAFENYIHRSEKIRKRIRYELCESLKNIKAGFLFMGRNFDEVFQKEGVHG